jgi:uncharacterized DUF497 family protein
MIVYNNFEWDVREAAACLARNGVTFKEASTVFAAESVDISTDPASGQLRAIGPSARGRMLVVLHQRGARLRILGVSLHKNRPVEVAAPEIAAPEIAAPEIAAPPSAPASRVIKKTAASPAPAEPTSAPRVVTPATAETENGADAASPDSLPSGAGWTAEAYGIYWEAYSAARQAARKQGKNHREAQRLGRQAGERAVAARTGEGAKEPARSSA